jgi:hypothetical protein
MKRIFKSPRDDIFYLNKLKEKSQITDSCWFWEGAKVSSGYGNICYNGKQISTHKLSMILHKKFESGKYIDHICKTVNCWNPAHLRMVTVTENTARFSESPSAINFKKTHCHRGHSFEEHSYLSPIRKKGQFKGMARVCRECKKIEYQKRKAKS